MQTPAPRQATATPCTVTQHGESLRSNPENQPFLFPAAQSPVRAAVLLVHGFTATPWEMRALGTALAEAGYLCRGICLPGHGTCPEDLVQCRYEDWLREVERGYTELAAEHPRIYGVGMSTGAMLLLALAARRPLAGLALLSPFLRLRHRLAPLVGILRFFIRYQYRGVPETLAAHYYKERPLNGVYQIHRLIRHLRHQLAHITTPTLILSAAGDRTVDAASAQELWRLLGSPSKRLHLFGAEVGHVLATRENPRWEETLGQILAFFEELDQRQEVVTRCR